VGSNPTRSTPLYIMKHMFIPIILGTARQGRRSEQVAEFVLEELRKQQSVETELVDVKDYRIAATDDTQEQPQSKRFAETAKKADGFVIISPEYNHGYPGELKMLLDMAYQEYNRKPIAICGVSAGGLGGARAVEQLRLLAIEFQMVPIRNAVYFSSVKSLFNEQGAITDNSYADRLHKLFEELLWYANALHEARTQ
jgi:NAD(P)H-dependent FMN reductase